MAGPQCSRKGSPRQRQVCPGPGDTDVVQSPSDCLQSLGVFPLLAISTRPYALAPSSTTQSRTRLGIRMQDLLFSSTLRGTGKSVARKHLSLKLNNNGRKINDGFLKVIIFTVISWAVPRSLCRYFSFLLGELLGDDSKILIAFSVCFPV